MAVYDITPQNSPKKPISGAFYGTSGYGVYQGGTAGFRVLAITQTQAGSCDLNVANPCTATSTHTVTTSTPEGTLSYVWSIPFGTATIASGQGTDTITVTTSNENNNTLFQVACEVTDTGAEVFVDTGVAMVNHTRIEETFFDGGMFVNGGFERGLDNWENYDSWIANVPEDNAENPATSINQLLFQNMTLIEGHTYRISAEYPAGDALINFMINDADSGVNVRDGIHSFVGIATAVSLGVYMQNVGTVKSVVDNMRLVHVPSPVVDFTATPDPLLIEYTPA